jgi:hypothetical protein
MMTFNFAGCKRLIHNLDSFVCVADMSEKDSKVSYDVYASDIYNIKTIDAIASDLNLCVKDLSHTCHGEVFVHPHVAHAFRQWQSPWYCAKVTRLIQEWNKCGQHMTKAIAEQPKLGRRRVHKSKWDVRAG